MQQRRSHQPRELEGETLELESSLLSGRCGQVRPDSKLPRMGIPAKHAHNDECRNRIAKLLMYEGAQRVESYFDRARVGGETSTGGAVLSSGSGTVVTDAPTVKRKAEETVETDARTKKRQTAVTTVPQVHVGGSSSSGSAVVSRLTKTKQRVVVPREVPQDTRSSIENMEIGQLRARREVREV